MGSPYLLCVCCQIQVPPPLLNRIDCVSVGTPASLPPPPLLELLQLGLDVRHDSARTQQGKRGGGGGSDEGTGQFECEGGEAAADGEEGCY